MRLPSRWLTLFAAVVVAIAALAFNTIAVKVESPAAGLTARHGAELPAPEPSGESTVFEHTRSFDVETEVNRFGNTRVRETIVQDFASTPRHGIERVIPLRDDIGVHPISNVVVSTSTGTPDDVSLNPQQDRVTIRIGDADTTITGAHTYRVQYDLGKMTTATTDGQALIEIDAISAWEQKIDQLRYTVTAPDAPTRIVCEQGQLGSHDPCASAEKTARGATFSGVELFANDAFTVTASWPDSVVAVNSGPSTFETADVLYALAAGLAVALIGWLYRRRWKQLYATAQTQLWATFGPDVAGPQADAYDLAGDPAIEFVPPMQLRPGEMGALTEAGPTKLLTATVIDLAARGAIKITESDGTWELERRNRDVPLTDDEQQVVTDLFGDADSTSLEGRGSEMGTLAGTLAEDLTDDLETRGLAVQGISAGALQTQAQPIKTFVLGIVAVLIGAAVHFVVVTATGSRGGALAAEAVVAGLILALGGFVMIRRAAHGLTPLGLAGLWRVRGFGRFFTQSEATHARAAADKGLLRQYMGYAIVFGHVREWLEAFDAPDTSDWFVSSSPLDQAFIGFTAASLWSPPASSGSSSGFGGGGGGAGGGSGGGGGGSW